MLVVHMGELLGITGGIGSGKTAAAGFLSDMVENHAQYEISDIVIEIANRFNQLLEAELHFETADADIDLVNQVLIWLPDVIGEHLHHDIVWNQLALTAKDSRAHPELYDKLFVYMAQVRANPQLIERHITRQNKNDYRPLLQWLGAYFVVKISPTIWFDEVFRRIDLHDSRVDLVIIGGVRYPDDAAYIRKRGGRVVAIERPTVQSDTTDATEVGRSQFEPDITIVNNGTLGQLASAIEDVWNDIAAGSPHARYRATR